MNRIKLLKSCLFVVALVSSNAVFGSNLNDLLDQVKLDGKTESKLHQQRESQFLSNQKTQAQLVSQTKNAIEEAINLKVQLDALLKSNNELISELESDIEDKAGDLSNVFSIVHQVSEDQSVALRQSVISAQFSNRLKSLTKIKDKNELPKIEDLKQLWLILQHQMTQTANVSKTIQQITNKDGVQQNEAVIRFGGFNAVSESGFLGYYAPTTSLLTLIKQPESSHLKRSSNWFDGSTAQLKEVVIDPSLGDILQLYLQKPSIKDRIKQAGLVGYAIIFIGLIGSLVALWRLIYLYSVNKKVQRQIQNLDDIQLDNPLGHLLNVAKTNNHTNTALLESKLEESILTHVPQLDKGTNFIKLLAAVAPLLGLLGTVTGMIATFQTIVDLGSSDPQSMAGGISQALLTTVFGLLAAVPLLFCHSFVTSKVRALTVILSQQSAGLLAMHIKQVDVKSTSETHD